MRHLFCLSVIVVLTFSATTSFANHDPAANDENAEQALLLSSTSTTTTAVVGGIILTVMMAADAGTMENYLEDNAVAVAADLRLGAGSTVDDLAAAFQIRAADRATFGKLLRSNRKVLLDLADPESLDRARAQKFIEVLVAVSVEAGLLDPESPSRG